MPQFQFHVDPKTTRIAVVGVLAFIATGIIYFIIRSIVRGANSNKAGATFTNADGTVVKFDTKPIVQRLEAELIDKPSWYYLYDVSETNVDQIIREMLNLSDDQLKAVVVSFDKKHVTKDGSLRSLLNDTYGSILDNTDWYDKLSTRFDTLSII